MLVVPGLAFVSLASIVLRSDIFVFYSAPTTGFLRCFSTFLPRNYRCSLVFLVLFSVRMRWVLMNCVLGLWLTMPRPSFTAISLHFLQTHTRTHTLRVLACPCLYVQFLWSQKIYQSRAQTFTAAFLLCLPSCSKTLGVWTMDYSQIWFLEPMWQKRKHPAGVAGHGSICHLGGGTGLAVYVHRRLHDALFMLSRFVFVHPAMILFCLAFFFSFCPAAASCAYSVPCYLS